MVNDNQPGPIGLRPDMEGLPGTWCIACDASGCYTMATYKGPYCDELIERARTQARGNGWQVSDKGDLCPDHAPKATDRG